MNATDNIATDLFYKIRSRFRGLKLGAENGTITIKPNEARFFDFDYMEGETPIGHVSISLAEPNSMKVYFSSGITESMDQLEKANWYGFLKELRQFAKRRLMAFDTRDIAKDNLDQRDYAFLSQNAQQTQPQQTAPVGESVMNESAMYGTKTMSFQKLMDTRLIVKHSQALVDDTQPGARTRHISALFVENQDGERFKYPFIHLAGARAMQRHVANGGLPYDDIGKSIITMSEQIAQLKSFNNYVVRNDLMNSDTNNIVERSSIALNNLREQIKALSKQGHYESYKSNFQIQETPEVPSEVVEDFTEKFTVRNFKEDIKSVFPVLYKLMQEQSDIEYDDIIEMTTTDEDVQEEAVEAYDPFSRFEDWAMNLGERSAVQDPEQQDSALAELNELMGQNFPAGVDGTNAIESLKGIIDDPLLNKQIEQASKEDPEMDCRYMVKKWLDDNAPEVVDQVDFGDMQEPEPEDLKGYADSSADADAEFYGKGESMEMEATDGAKKSDIPAALRKSKNGTNWKVSVQDLDKEKERNISSKEWLKKQDEASDDNQDKEKNNLPFDPDKEPSPDKDEYGNVIKHKAKHLARKAMRQQMDVKELAEFIHSFYDRKSGTFPKGPEGVCTMVGKKFGEQAEHVARKMVERMAPQQQVENSDMGDGIVVGGRVVSVEHPDMKGKVVMIDPKMAQRVHVQWDQGGRAEPVQRSRLKAISNENAELDRIRQLSGVHGSAQEITAQEADGDEDKTAAIQAWAEKYGRYRGANGDSLPEGWLQYQLNTGVPSDAYEDGEFEAMRVKYGDDMDENPDLLDEMPITKAMFADLAKIFGEPAGEEEAEIVNKVLGTFESAAPELEDIKRLSGISRGMGF